MYLNSVLAHDVTYLIVSPSLKMLLFRNSFHSDRLTACQWRGPRYCRRARTLPHSAPRVSLLRAYLTRSPARPSLPPPARKPHWHRWLPFARAPSSVGNGEVPVAPILTHIFPTVPTWWSLQVITGLEGDGDAVLDRRDSWQLARLVKSPVKDVQDGGAWYVYIGRARENR